jgi:hypothetical protein
MIVSGATEVADGLGATAELVGLLAATTGAEEGATEAVAAESALGFSHPMSAATLATPATIVLPRMTGPSSMET